MVRHARPKAGRFQKSPGTDARAPRHHALVAARIIRVSSTARPCPVKVEAARRRVDRALRASVGKRPAFSHENGKPYRNVSSRFSAIVRATAAWAKKQGIEFTPFRFHDLRHRHAVNWLKSRRSIYDLQQRLGHKSIKTTEIYLDYLTSDERRAVIEPVAQKATQRPARD
jgi:integrase